jgi:outer membrane receptor protein involved in Fe transport
MPTNFTLKKKSLAIAISAACVSIATTAQAQEQSTSLLEEVIVTAQYREQSVQDIPYNISAVAGDAIKRNNIVNTNDLLRTLPGVSVIDRGYRKSGVKNSIVVRGLNLDAGNSGDIGSAAVAPVSTYVDNSPVFANFLLKDIQRVELLRGPQGTLYGSGSLGGTVRYISNAPSTEATTFEITQSIGVTDGSGGINWSTDGVLNLPISDRSALRVTAGTVQNDGFIDYVNLYDLDANGVPMVETDSGACVSVGQATNAEIFGNGSCYHGENDANDVDIWYARVSLRMEPSDKLSLQFNYQTQQDEIGGRRAVSSGVDGFGNAYGDDDLGATFLEPSERDAQMFSADVVYDMGFATFTSNTSYYDLEDNGWHDNTSLWVSGGRDWFNAWYTGNARPAAYVEAGIKDEAIVQEFRLVSNTDEGDSWDWVVGAYYMDQDKTTTNFSHLVGLLDFGTACATDPVCDAGNTFGLTWYVPTTNDIDNYLLREENFTDFALYGEMTYHVSDTFRITGGLRYFDNELSNNTALNASILQPAVIPSQEFGTQKEDDVLFKLNLSWDFSDSAMAYATFSQGFRRGGANSIPVNGQFAEPNPETVELYGKDTVDNFEIGIKGATENVRYQANLFHVDWDTPQLNTTTKWWGFFMAQNGDSARSQGVEIELESQLSDSVRATVGYSYTDAELTADLLQPQSVSPIRVLAPDGTRLPSVPESVATFALDHNTTISGMGLTSRLSGYYQSDSTNHINPTSQVQDQHGSFSLWNLTSSLAINEKWNVALHAQNIFNEEAVAGTFPLTYFSNDTGVNEGYFGNNSRNFIALPRTFTVTVNYSF